ncbi:unnamed protein product, partial [Scytosiphon promiscuus]
MVSSERLDALVARARALFESKHGHSEGCFAAYSPAKLNVMGDAVEGSGGLGLQVAIDRRVIVYGRGRVLRDPNHPHLPTRDGKRRQQPPSAGVSRMAVLEEAAGEGGDTGSVGGGDSFPASKLLDKWSVNQRRKNAGKAVDTMVQQLVFGRKGRSRSKSVHSPGRQGEATGAWLKNNNRNASTASLKSWDGGGGSGSGSGGGGSSHSTYVQHFPNGSSIHGASVHSASMHSSLSASAMEATVNAAPIPAGGAQYSRIAARAEGEANLHPDGTSTAKTPHKRADNTPPFSSGLPTKLSSPSELGGAFVGDYKLSGGTTATGGSTTTEEAFPVGSGGSNSEGSTDNGSNSSS